MSGIKLNQTLPEQYFCNFSTALPSACSLQILLEQNKLLISTGHVTVII